MKQKNTILSLRPMLGVLSLNYSNILVFLVKSFSLRLRLPGVFLSLKRVLHVKITVSGKILMTLSKLNVKSTKT